MNHAIMRRRTRIAQILLLVILVGGTVYVTDTVVGGSLTHHPYRVSVRLEEAAGLHQASVVTYRGQRIGEVTEVGLTGRGIEAELALDEDVEVPRDSEVRVSNLSAVGEQYLDIRPRTDEGPVLAEGDVIDEVGTPVPVHEVVADTQHLLGRVDVRDIETITRETDRVFGDGSVDLRRTLTGLERTRDLLVAIQPDLETLVRRGEVPLRTGVDHAQDLRDSSRALAQVADTLHRSDRDLQVLLRDGAETLTTVHGLWRSVSPVLADLLRLALPVAVMSEAHLPGLRHWLRWGPSQLVGMAGSTRDGSGHVMLVPRPLDNCLYAQDPQSTFDPKRRPPELDRHCRTEAEGIQQRGSQNVPRP